MRPAISKTIKLFFRTTTLHGFKYLYQGYYYDRAAWAACCVASACCAGALCGVVWARFLQIPAILVLRDLRTQIQPPLIPIIALCPTPGFVARQVISYLSLNPNEHLWLPTVLHRLLRKRFTDKGQLARLEHLLYHHNATLNEVLLNSLPDCGNLARKCRWRNRMVQCHSLFVKMTTKWGACCLLEPHRLADINVAGDMKTRNINVNEHLFFELDSTMGIANNGSPQVKVNSCELITKFSGEEWSEPTALSAGRDYYGRLRFTAIRDPLVESLDTHCEPDPIYSQTRCMIRCHERRCGCSDPLRLIDRHDWQSARLPDCSVVKMGCLREIVNADSLSCSCKPSCRKLVSLLGLEALPINALKYTIQSSEELNPSTFLLLNIFIRISDSQLFERFPTESWLTLLSSLGGVFNMFLGVGLFSALEFLFLVLIRLPLALKQSTEMEKPSSTSTTVYAIETP